MAAEHSCTEHVCVLWRMGIENVNPPAAVTLLCTVYMYVVGSYVVHSKAQASAQKIKKS